MSGEAQPESLAPTFQVPEDPTPEPQPVEAPAEAAPEPEAPLAPLLTLRDGLPKVIETDEDLAEACAALASGTGPTAIDAERASGYRYSARAYLIQVRREGAGSFLIDPIGLTSLAPLHEAMSPTEWILHAATQDLPCLGEVGLRPTYLFDTELAGRLLGYPRVGLATLTETILGMRMRKEHSAVDWSTRPLPTPWLTYAALDVEVLIELRNVLHQELIDAGKWEWAEQEFEALLSFQPTVRPEAWRRTTGMHKVRGRRGLGAVRAMWEERDRLARERDVTPSRILPDSAIVIAAQALPQDRATLLGLRGFHGRGAERYAARWVAALQAAANAPEDDLPSRTPAHTGPPMPRAWADKDPIAARRLVLAREAIAAISESQHVPVENMLVPDHLRRTLWAPPETRDPDLLKQEVGEQLRELGARQWQIDLIGPAIVAATLEAELPIPDASAEEVSTEAVSAVGQGDGEGEIDAESSGNSGGTSTS